MYQIHPTAEIADNARIGNGTSIWHYAQVREDCIVGENVTIGRGVYVGNGVQIGQNSKIQNYSLVYEPAILEQGVFLGPGVVLTNDTYPRAVNPDGTRKTQNDWNSVGVTIREGASIGAGAVCIAPVEIGAWALVAAGSVVTQTVPSYALMVGVPARRLGWVGKAGIPLIDEGSGFFTCPKTGTHYVENAPNTLTELDN
jgi:UDP-2-acetamido-3-amino-2,3-dideoxy-glucuronate N-acetyltransferase